MFEEMMDLPTNAAPIGVTDHVLAVFEKAKQLNAQSNELWEIEKIKRTDYHSKRGSRSKTCEERRLLPFEVKGLSENRDQYKSNFATINELCLVAIQQEKQKLENRLSDLGLYQQALETELQEYVDVDSMLQEKSKGYAEKLASGDIAGADLLENNRKVQLQDNDVKKQDIIHKIEGVKAAEGLIKADISIYAEMEKISRHSLLLKEYNTKKVLFDERLESVRESHEELSNIATELWGDNYARWEHITQQNDIEKKLHWKKFHIVI